MILWGEMTDFLFEYDHMLIRSEYRTPDMHSHLAVHLVIALDGKLNVVVEDKEFQINYFLFWNLQRQNMIMWIFV